MRRLLRLSAPAIAAVLLIGTATTAVAHEQRDVGGYQVVVGFIDEPVFSGQKSGLEFMVAQGDEPVEGLEESLQSEVSFEAETRELPISPRFGQPGWYESIFFPTAAGSYTFRIFGEIAGEAIDESFTSGPDTFGDVGELASGQFPVQLPAMADLASDAQAGADAAGLATLGVVLGAAGLLVGLLALGLAVGRRRA